MHGEDKSLFLSDYRLILAMDLSFLMQCFNPFAEFIVDLHYILHSSASDQGTLITAREI